MEFLAFLVPVLPFLMWYIIIGGFVLGINAVIAGYYGLQTDLQNIKSSIIWPISLLELIGSLIALLIQWVRGKK